MASGGCESQQLHQFVQHVAQNETFFKKKKNLTLFSLVVRRHQSKALTRDVTPPPFLHFDRQA